MLLKGNNLDLLKSIPGNSIDSIVTDPPYGLKFMGKKWDYDVPSKEFWIEIYRVLKPGGHILSFGGTRTYHRMVVNIEDAGFEIRDCISWLYGSGFPKSLNIGKAVDKFGGNNSLSKDIGKELKEARLKRKLTLKQADELFCNGTSNYNWLEGRIDGQRIPNQELFDKIVLEWPELKDIRNKVLETEREVLGTTITNTTIMRNIGSKNISGEIEVTKGSSEYEGYGTALKPAQELICVARKPLSENTVASNVLKWGTGGINIDECRIGVTGAKNNGNTKGTISNSLGYFKPTEKIDYGMGRFPANIIFDDFAAIELDKQSGSSKSVKRNASVNKKGYKGDLYTPIDTDYRDDNTYGDSGGASRFFYVAKVSKKERNMGLEDFEGRIPIGRDPNQDKTNTKHKPTPTPKANFHPTVKPINLLTYLCRLITPKNGTILDPFMGSGSTGIAAKLEGFNFIGMEMDEDYFKIAEQRIAEYEQYRKLLK